MMPMKANSVSGEHEHHALAHGVVEQARVVLVDEPGELLVGQEEQHVVDARTVALAGVVARRQPLHPLAHVGEERA